MRLGEAALPSCLCLIALEIGSAAVAAAGRPVTLTSLDGTTIAGQFYEAASRPAPAVVLVHMLGRSKADWDGLATDLESSAGISVLAIDLRGHGASGGSSSDLSRLVQDVRAGLVWLTGRQGVRPDAIGAVGASLGANLVLLAAAEEPAVRAVAAVSPSLDYRGVRVNAELMKKLGVRWVWLAASADDPFAVRTIRELDTPPVAYREQRLSSTAGHGTNLLAADRELARALVDWLRQRLLS